MLSVLDAAQTFRFPPLSLLFPWKSAVIWGALLVLLVEGREDSDHAGSPPLSMACCGQTGLPPPILAIAELGLVLPILFEIKHQHPPQESTAPGIHMCSPIPFSPSPVCFDPKPLKSCPPPFSTLPPPPASTHGDFWILVIQSADEEEPGLYLRLVHLSLSCRITSVPCWIWLPLTYKPF